jgi:hypothetical protein
MNVNQCVHILTLFEESYPSTQYALRVANVNAVANRRVPAIYAAETIGRLNQKFFLKARGARVSLR